MKNKAANLFLGDCIEVMQTMETYSIDLTVTSPPYDNLRTYNGSLDWSEKIWEQVLNGLYRVTKHGGVVVWVVGDATIKGSETGTSFKQALYAKKIGFNLHDTMIWEKPNFANPSNNRFHQIFEYMFIFSKGKIKTFNPIKDKKNIYTKPFGSNSCRLADGYMKQVKSQNYSDYGMRTNIWKMNTSGQENPCKKIEHPATFPEKLAQDHIVSWSNEDDTVFDPFMGSGTTGKMAKQLNRNFIGIEKEKSYFKIAKKRIG